MRADSYLGLIAVFVPFSLVSIGGGPSIFAGMQHESVDVMHWLSAREFIDLFAIARVAPGPGTMLATLIGWKVAGISGAIVATLAIFLPSSLACWVVAHFWHRYRDRAWHAALVTGLVPVGAGLMFSGVLSILRLENAGWLSWGVGLAGAAILTKRKQTHPFVILTGAAAIFVLAELAGLQAT
jgi:chromate transporter